MNEQELTDTYKPCVLVARKEQVYTTDGKFMFSVSMTERAKELLDNDGWEKEQESWLDYRKRTEKEREIEEQKRYKLAADLVKFFNNATKKEIIDEINLLGDCDDTIS